MPESPSSDEVVEQYLNELGASLTAVPPGIRSEFMAEIRQHIAEGRADLDPEDVMGLRTMLDRLGTPSALAAELSQAETTTSSAGVLRQPAADNSPGSRRSLVNRFSHLKRSTRVVTAVAVVLVALALSVGGVLLTRNGGKEPPSSSVATTTTQAALAVTVPNLIGETLQESEVSLLSLGLSYEVVIEKSSPGSAVKANTITSQEPSPGSHAHYGSLVVLTLYE